MGTSQAWRFSTYLLFGLLLVATTLHNVQGEHESDSEAPSQCRPFIEKALKEQQKEEVSSEGAIAGDDSEHDASVGDIEPDAGETATVDSTEAQANDSGVSAEAEQADSEGDAASLEQAEESIEIQNDVQEETAASMKKEMQEESVEDASDTEGDETTVSTEETLELSVESQEEEGKSQETEGATEEQSDTKTSAESQETGAFEGESTEEQLVSTETQERIESVEEVVEATESETALESGEATEEAAEAESAQDTTDSTETAAESASVEGEAESLEATAESTEAEEDKLAETEPAIEVVEGEPASVEETAENKESVEEQAEPPEDTSHEEQPAKEREEVVTSVRESEVKEGKSVEESTEEQAVFKEAQNTALVEEAIEEVAEEPKENEAIDVESGALAQEESNETVPEEDLILDIEIPESLRPRDHIDQLLKLDDSNDQGEAIVNKINEMTLKDLKKLYENAIRPLETLYKYRDLSNRHFGDSEIFSKPLVVFMGPWSGGKSSIVNYLLDNEYNATSLRTGAEPSPAYFNLVMYGEEPEILDGTQLAADFTFAGLQKFGQGLEERLRGLKFPNKLLEKINIVEIPGILEVRKQVSRVFPFNDACQWFIDRADIIFLVYDPSKLDVGPETEAILDQLKGREHQTRIVLNKADQVKPEELMRVQSALIWNISPLMSSAQPPVMYTTSLWSRPYENSAPVRLLQAQERAFLRDLRSAVDKRIENKISSARRFAVRVRNHAKMVDCYLTTYYNHKSVFGNRKQVADQIIEHPQDYHIYEGLSTLTNISRYDLPDPEVYRDFFRLNPLYDFQQLSATCTYFRGCPINRLDVAIAYDLPELVGKHKKLVEGALAKIKADNS